MLQKRMQNSFAEQSFNPVTLFLSTSQREYDLFLTACGRRYILEGFGGYRRNRLNYTVTDCVLELNLCKAISERLRLIKELGMKRTE